MEWFAEGWQQTAPGIIPYEKVDHHNRTHVGGAVALFAALHTFCSPPVAARPVKMVITGPDGQRFTGRYVADGVTNAVSAIASATINLQAREVAYEFQWKGGDGEFRVALFVGDLCRTFACGTPPGKACAAGCAMRPITRAIGPPDFEMPPHQAGGEIESRW